MDLIKKRTKWIIDYVVKNRNLTNKKIAEQLGFTENTVGSYRNMGSDPKLIFVQKFCNEYSINLTWFVTGEGEPFPGARLQFPEVCGSALPNDGIRALRTGDDNNKTQDPDGLWGKTKSHEVEGNNISVTEFKPRTGLRDPAPYKEHELALIRVLRLCGSEYMSRVYIAATIRAQNVLADKRIDTEENLKVKKDLETLSIASIE